MTPEEIKKAKEDLQKIKEFFAFQNQRQKNAKIDAKGESKNHYTIDADESLRVQQEDHEAGYKMEMLGNAIKKHLNKETIDKINSRYDQICINNNWIRSSIEGSLCSKTIIYDNDPAKRETYYNIVFEELENNLEFLNNKGNMLDDVSKIKTPTELPLESNFVYTYQQKIDEIKATTDSKDDKKLLDEVNGYLASRSDEAYDYISSHEIRDRGTAITDYQARNSLEKLANGQFGTVDSYTKQYISANDTKYFTINKPNVIQGIINHKPTISPEDKKAIINITNKLKEYNFVNPNSAIEQGFKVYNYEELVKYRKPLKTAVESGDIKQIKEAAEKYKVKHEQLKEVFGMVKTSFPDKTLAPGNVASIRNKALPPEFTLDYVTDSRVNGLYQLTSFCYKLDITVEQFMEAPAKYIMGYLDKRIKDKPFEKINKIPGKDSFVSSYEALISRGVDIDNDDVSVTNELADGDPSLIATRVLDGLSLVMQNHENVMELQRLKHHIREIYSNKVTLEEEYQRCANDILSNPNKDAELTRQMHNGLKQAFLEGSSIEKRHLPMPYTDSNGLEIARPSYSDSLKTKDLYTKIMNNYNKCLPDLENLRERNNSGEADYKIGDKPIILNIEAAMFDYLMAHPEDAKKNEYKQLEQMALGAEKQLGIDSSRPKPTPADKYKKWKKDFAVEHNSLFEEAKKRAKEQNKIINRYQKRISKLDSKKDSKSIEETNKLKKAMHEAINDMIKDEIEAYALTKSTDTYLRTRIKNLKDIQQNYKTKTAVPKTFIDEKNPENFTKDAGRINYRVNNNMSEDYLQSRESFIKWKLQQSDMELLDQNELSTEEWDLLYENAKMAKRGALDIPKDLEPVPFEEHDYEKSILSDWTDEKGNDLDLSRKKPKQEKDMSLKGRKKALKDLLTNDEIMSKLADPNTPANEREALDNQLTSLLAETITAEIIKRNGSLPNNEKAEIFSKRMSSEPSFRSVTKPVLQTVYNDYAKYKSNPQAGFWGPEAMNKMVDSGTLLSAANADQRHFQGLSNDAIKDQISRGVETPGSNMAKNKYNELKKEVIKEKQQAMNNEKKTGPAGKVLGQ